MKDWSNLNNLDLSWMLLIIMDVYMNEQVWMKKILRFDN